MAANKGCLPAAVKLLANRDHSERELRQKLLRRYGAAEIDDAVAVLKARHYLDDAALTCRLAARYANDGQHGVWGIRAKLLERGLPAAAIDAALAGLDAACEYEWAAALCRQRFPAAQAGELPKIGRFLAARGFAAETITALFGRLYGYDE
jgi:regulatory protein